MYTVWQDNLNLYNAMAAKINRPTTIAVVSSQNDVNYWSHKFNSADLGHASHVIRCVPGRIETGNYLSSIAAWSALKDSQRENAEALESAVIQLIIGRGIRLSPFTQALGNCKGAFPLPIHSNRGKSFLSVAQLSEFCANACLSCLANTGFSGVLVQWADEILIPGINLLSNHNQYKDADVIRFMMQSDISDELARNKEWLVADRSTGRLKYEFARQDSESLLETLRSHGDCLVGVNLGTFAASHQFMDILCDIFKEYVEKPCIPIDWDPYFWMALLPNNISNWTRRREYEEIHGFSGLVELEKYYPDFFQKVQQVREIFENRYHRPINCLVLNLDEPFWIDMGSHRALRNHLQDLLNFGDVSRFARLLYGIPENRDKNGNTIVRSSVNVDATIKNSLIIDANISGAGSYIDGGVIIGGSYGTVEMPDGGNALSSVVGNLRMEDRSSMIFRLLTEKAHIAANDRKSTIPFSDTYENIAGFEDMEQMKEYYNLAMKDNRMSFAEASDRISEIDMLSLCSWYNSSAKEFATRMNLDFPNNDI